MYNRLDSIDSKSDNKMSNKAGFLFLLSMAMAGEP